MFILLNKRNTSLSGAPPVRSPHPHHSFIFTQPLVIYWSGTCKIITFKPRGKQVKTPPLFFFQNKIYFTKTLPILLAKMACLIIKKKKYHV